MSILLPRAPSRRSLLRGILGGGAVSVALRHCQTNWPGAEEAIIQDLQAAS